MADSHIASGLKAKRARVAGEIIRAQETIAKRIKELTTLDAAIVMFSPDCGPEMIAPIRPSTHGLFFQYRELTRLTLDIPRQSGTPLRLGQIVDRVMEVKGLPDDRGLWRHVCRTTRRALPRLARKGTVRQVVVDPDQWWEVVG
jgi:hypothetical protein